jgi:hypothetical protein
VAQRFGELMKRSPKIVGQEAPDALLNNGSLGHRLFGAPSVTSDEMIHRIAHWVQRGGASLGKPTHFQARDGKF